MTATRYDLFQQKLPDYAREAVLTPDEVEALAQFPSENARTRPQRLRKSEQHLKRLLQPLTDVLDILGAKQSQIRNNVLEAFLREIACRQHAYWAWTHADWNDWLHRLETGNIPNYAH